MLAAVADLDAWQEWMPGLVRVEKLTEGPFGVGTRWRETRVVMKREATEEFEVVEYDPPRSLTLPVKDTEALAAYVTRS